MTPFLTLALIAAPIQLHDTSVLYDQTLVPNTESTAFVSVHASHGIDRRSPLAGASIEVMLGGKSLATQKTDRDGRAVVSFRVPSLKQGSHRLEIVTTSKLGTDRIGRNVAVRSQAVLSLRTDRTLYRPGETLSYVVALVRHSNATPIAGQKVALAITDPGGTEIWRGEIATNKSGFGTGRLPLSEDLRLGKYTLRASARGQSKKVSVSVKEVELPSFFVTIDTENQLVTARYPYGEPVQGVGTLSANGKRIARSQLDGFGRFTIPKPGKGVTIEAEVTDGAGRTERASLTIAEASTRIEAALVPERSSLTPGRKQYVTLVTTNGEGRLLPASVGVSGTNVKFHGPRVRQSPGAVRFLITPQRGARLEAVVYGPNGNQRKVKKRLSFERGRGWVRPRVAVVQDGSAVEVFGGFSGARGPIIVSLMRDSVPVASSFALPDDKGNFNAQVAAPSGVFGLSTIRAVELKERPRVAATTIYLSPTPLNVALQGQARHRPGTTAELLARVTDRAGAPAPGVGLFASVVDERSLALSKKQPDLVELLTKLDVKKAKVLGLVFADLLGASGRAEQLTRRAIIETLPAHAPRPTVQRDHVTRRAREAARIPGVRRAVIDTLVEAKTPLGKYDPEAGWTSVRSISSILRAAGWNAENTMTPWKRAISWKYVRHFDRHGFKLGRITREVQRQRMERVSAKLRSLGRGVVGGSLSKAFGPGGLGRGMRNDVWGKSMQLGAGALRSAGPDANFGTADDIVMGGVFSSAGAGGLGVRGSGMGGGGSAYGVGGLGARRTRSVSIKGPPAAIRAKFDETVLWAAGIVTDSEGQATIRVPFSDSVTGWKLAVDALGGNGAVGRGVKRLETFLPLSVDASVPRVLTTGDKFTLRVVAANHTAGSKNLTVMLKSGGGIEGTRQETVALPPGATRAVRAPIFAARAGDGQVTLTLMEGDRVVDIVKRKVRVDAPGRMRRMMLTSVVDESAGRIEFDLPEAPAEESFEGRIRLYRNPSDQALDGVEGLLREPHGCFEQTSSATYPNLMVLDLLQHDPKAQKVKQRAYDLVGKGYQKLISFEVSGGGFSWFGKAPAHRALTAYGLMEFADMAKVYPVDANLISRTKRWLIGQQGADGSWPPDDTFLHDWSAVQGKVSATAYVVWALAESGERGASVKKGLKYLRKSKKQMANKPYLLALWAAAESLVDPSRAAQPLKAMRSFSKKTDDGLQFSAEGQTLFFAKGKAADAQVTALAVSSLRRLNATSDAQHALRWLWSARTPRYGWGTPQGTVLALRAAAMATPTPSKGDNVGIALNGAALGRLSMLGTGVPTLSLPALGAGRHAIDMTSAAGLLADVQYSWRSKANPAAISAGMIVTLDVPAGPIGFGQTAKLRLAVENPSAKDVIMPTAIVPIAPGFRPNTKSLKRLKQQGRIERFESTGAALHLYLTKLPAKKKIELDVTLTAEAECDVTQRAARVYAYYSPETMGESDTHRLSAKLKQARVE